MLPIKDWSEIDNKEFDVKRTFEKSELAKDQLRTAIWLFLNRIDFASAITLAGAAGNILHALVEHQNKQPTLEYGRLLCSKLIGHVPGRSKYLKNFGDLTGINRLKHMSAECPDTIEIDLEKCAETAITRAVLDFIKLYGDAEARSNPAVNSFMQWLWVLHGERMMKEYGPLLEGLKEDGFKTA
ncbi:MAG: hypothetical protein HYS17_02355 [Micavibrio aeruginosavorus]|uniref:Uncharacterized protein n=1 Tax=Micavibrio aeruginosavorus TaxID=349221 RepID=A0A7T5R330_9BACT|nr:MAG: hypothetical protein HYS17_02355 [Micavibrio aeruginosavorus]